MHDHPPTLSFLVNHYRTPAALQMCLDQIIDRIKTLDYEIIVTDSGTEKETAEFMKRDYPDVLFLSEPKDIGFARSVNRAIRKARGTFLFIINADILIGGEENVLKIMHYYEAHHNVGLIGPKLLNTDGSIQQSFFREYTLGAILAKRTIFGKTRWGKKALGMLEYDRQRPKTPFEVEWVMGSALFIKKDMLEKMGGGLDERYFMYFEDSDWCKRIRNAGLKVVYYPHAVMTHGHKRESHGGHGMLDIFINWLTRVHIASYCKFVWKWDVEYPIKTLFSRQR